MKACMLAYPYMITSLERSTAGASRLKVPGKVPGMALMKAGLEGAAGASELKCVSKSG